MTARPMKNTSLPSVPVCQPMTAIVGPLDPDPAYQSVKAETLSTRPATQVARSPTAVMLPAIAPARPSGLALKLLPLGGSSDSTVEVCSSSAQRPNSLWT